MFRKTLPILFLLLTLLSNSVLHAQERHTPVQELVSAAHVQEPAFTPVELFTLIPRAERQVNKRSQDVLTNYEELLLDLSRFSLKQAPETMQLRLPGGSFGDLRLELVRAKVLTDDFTLLTSESNEQPITYQGAAHYRGVVAGDPHSMAAISVLNGEVMGAISTQRGTFTLGKIQSKDKASNRHLLYREADLLVEANSTCGTETPVLTAKDRALMEQIARGEAGQRNKSTNCVRVYLELDYTLVTEKGGAAGAMNWMEGLWNQVAILYQNENITTELSQVFAWTSPDPTPTSSTTAALNYFRATRTNFNGDLAHFISRGAPAGGGVAYLDALCTNFNYAYSWISSSYAQVPTYSWAVNVITHEMGHNLGSYHTHDCVWNGNSTAIDGCGPQAGYAGIGSCSAVPLPPSGGGTIMSYCHLLGGVGISLTNGFGTQPGNLIRAKVDAAGCLTGCTAPDCFLAGLSSTLSSCSTNDGTATVTLSGGTAPFTYAWSSGATTATATSLAPGSYTVTITDATNCSESHAVTVSAAPAPVLTMDGWQSTGTANGRARARTTGGTPPYTYSWNTGATTNDLQNVVAGTYSVTVTDFIGCTATDVFVIEDGSVGCTGNLLRLTIQADQFPGETYWGMYDGQGQGLFQEFLGQEGITAGGLYSYVFCLPDGCYAFAMFDGQANGLCNPNSTPPGYFELEDLTNGGTIHSGCDYINVNTQAFCLGNNTLVTATATDVTCNGGVDGTATVNGLYPTAITGYAWSNGGTTQTITGLAPGTYSVTVTNNVYVESASVTVSEPAPLTATTSITPENAGNNDGTASVTVSGGTAPYAYAWSNGGTTAIIGSLSAGTYTVTITDANGCTESASATVTADYPPVTVTTTVVNVSCNGGADGSITAFAAGGAGPSTYQYQWNTGATTQSITGLTAGTYQVAAISLNDFVVATIVVTEPPALVLTASTTDATVGQSDGSATVAAAGGTPGYNYAWSNGGTSSSINNVPAGNYGITVTDANGCTSTAVAVVVETGTPLTLSVSGNNVSCWMEDDGTAFVAAGGGTGSYSYLWNTGATTPGLTGLEPGTYSVTVTSGTATESGSIVITEPTRVNVGSSSTSAGGAPNGTLSATVTGGVPPYTWLWSNGATTANQTGLYPGTYSVTATDATGCTGDITVQVNDITQQVSLSSTATDVSCFGDADGSAAVAATGGSGSYDYLWSTGATTATVTGLAPGTYSVTVTSFTRTATTTVTVNEPTALSVSMTNSNSAQGQATGSATAIPGGGTPAYSYAWSNGDTTQHIANLATGTYTVTVTDANGCTVSGSVIVEEYEPGLELFISNTDVSCNGGADGAALAQPSGGNGNYTYLWSTGATSAAISGLVAGSYSVTVTAGAQTNTGVVLISEPAAIALNGTVINATNGANGTVSVAPANGTAPYTYLWSIGNQTTAAIQDLPQGFYTCTVTDANGCTTSELFTVTDLTPACNDEAIKFRIQLDDHPDETTWEIKNGNGQTVASGGPYVVDFMYLEYNLCLPAGCYDLTVFDAGGNGLGSGYYEITRNNSLVLDGSNFGASETQNFCLGATPQIVMERGRITTNGDAWQTVQLTNIYTNPVVIATPVITGISQDPVVTRIRNAGASSVDIRVQRPGGSTTDSYSVEYVVVEEGVYDYPTYGVRMEAVRTTSSRTAARSRWGSNYRESRSYQQSYLSPVVLGQVMSVNDNDFSVFWASRSNSQSNAPTQSSFAAGKHVAEDSDRTRANESLGYIVIEAGTGTINGEEYAAGVGSDIVRGQQNSSQGYLYNVPANLYLTGGVLSSAAMDGGDGGWPVFNADPIGAGGFRLSVEEDQIRDNERSHTTEQAAYLMFGLDLGSTPAAAPEATDLASSPAPLVTPLAPAAAPDLLIYPNPTSDRLHVVFSPAIDADVELTIYDLTGRQILSRKLRGEVRESIDVSDLKAGLYLLSLRSGQELRTKRFTVN